MKTVLRFRAMWLSAALVFAVIPHQQAHAQITNGGFESGFTGWTRADQLGSDGTFFVQTGTTSPLNGFTVPAPPQGTQAAMTDAGAGGSHILYQDFVVPTTATTGTVSFSLFINSGDAFRSPATLDWAATNPTGGLNLNQQARVDVIRTAADPFSVAGADVLQNLYRTLPGDPLVSGYNLFTVDITGVIQSNLGGTVRLRFAEVDNVSFFNLGVDQVGVAFGAIPEPSSLALAGVGATLALLGLTRTRRRRSSHRTD